MHPHSLTRSRTEDRGARNLEEQHLRVEAPQAKRTRGGRTEQLPSTQQQVLASCKWLTSIHFLAGNSVPFL